MHLVLSLGALPFFVTGLFWISSRIGLLGETLRLLLLLAYAGGIFLLEIQRGLRFHQMLEKGDEEIERYCSESEATLERWRIPRLIAVLVLGLLALLALLVVFVLPSLSAGG
ncbi:MAG: hypothetical protein DWQ36_05420 [Acidobacteria bacterium]|nr:MAG: hypothetical protein DWQ30_12910 [Acidobacteriota bacterium]REK10080.1 MAG: hypothetical protein DWQ36_05420 [Acidobacteriota bacterium]